MWILHRSSDLKKSISLHTWMNSFMSHRINCKPNEWIFLLVQMCVSSCRCVQTSCGPQRLKQLQCACESRWYLRPVWLWLLHHPAFFFKIPPAEQHSKHVGEPQAETQLTIVNPRYSEIIKKWTDKIRWGFSSVVIKNSPTLSDKWRLAQWRHLMLTKHFYQSAGSRSVGHAALHVPWDPGRLCEPKEHGVSHAGRHLCFGTVAVGDLDALLWFIWRWTCLLRYIKCIYFLD